MKKTTMLFTMILMVLFLMQNMLVAQSEIVPDEIGQAVIEIAAESDYETNFEDHIMSQEWVDDFLLYKDGTDFVTYILTPTLLSGMLGIDVSDPAHLIIKHDFYSRTFQMAIRLADGRFLDLIPVCPPYCGFALLSLFKE